jgi:glutathione peroxidase
MFRITAAIAAATLLAGAWAALSFAEQAAPAVAVGPVHKFTVNDIDGKPVDLSRFAGKSILIVNVASRCGNTPQYAALEDLYKKYEGKGLVILGFPANNFGKQEPGTNEEIKQFCSSKYAVTFPMFSKISVKGEDIDPLYKHLTTQETKPVGKGDVTWNFEKFLVGKDGNVIARFSPKTQPNDAKLVEAIEASLK